MPPHGKEIQLTELEVDIMGAFVKQKILTDAKVMEALLQLYAKVASNYATHKKDNPYIT